MSARIAFVTGASRGIGAATCIALARRGFTVVPTARTLREGKTADGRPLPGSLERTAEAVRGAGAEAFPIPLDLLEPATIDAAVRQTFEQYGRIDLLVNNGIYTGPGTMERVLELSLDTVETMFRANVFAQLQLVQAVLPHMLERGRGTIVNLVSGAGLSDPPAPAGQGGWGYAYAATKAAFHRMVGVLAVETPSPNVRFHNVEPGFIMTEAMKLNDPDGEIAARFDAAPPAVPAAVIAWLATDPRARERNGQTIFAQQLALELGLHPDWRRAAGSSDRGE